VQTVNLRFLGTRPAPARTSHDTLAFERHVYKVTAAVTLVRPEDDGDFHLVLRTGLLHVIAEAPSPGCIARAAPAPRAQMRPPGRRACLRTSEHHRGLVFRLQARPDRRRTQRDRVAPDPQVELPQPLTRTKVSRGMRDVRGRPASRILFADSCCVFGSYSDQLCPPKQTPAASPGTARPALCGQCTRDRWCASARREDRPATRR
jgi:hypothetical protein